MKETNSVSSSTIARWLKEVLHLAGIDTSIFKAHSYRSASTSAAFSCGISLGLTQTHFIDSIIEKLEIHFQELCCQRNNFYISSLHVDRIVHIHGMVIYME